MSRSTIPCNSNRGIRPRFIIQPQPPCPGELVYEDDEYGSLADGGSYERYRCDRCGLPRYFELPD